VDEFQRIADVPQRKGATFTRNIVSLFNACSSGLHVVLSFSVAQQSTATALLPLELRSRAQTFPLLTLPPLTERDCRDFCEDLFGAFRDKPAPSSIFPFDDQSMSLVLNQLQETALSGVTPRLLMERFESTLFEVYEASSGRPELPIKRSVAEAALQALEERAGAGA
jgi:hypothetical protein